MKEADELLALIAQLKLGGQELPIQDYVNMIGEDCVEVEYNLSELVNIALNNGLSTPMILISTSMWVM